MSLLDYNLQFPLCALVNKHSTFSKDKHCSTQLLQLSHRCCVVSNTKSNFFYIPHIYVWVLSRCFLLSQTKHSLITTPRRVVVDNFFLSVHIWRSHVRTFTKTGTKQSLSACWQIRANPCRIAPEPTPIIRYVSSENGIPRSR